MFGLFKKSENKHWANDGNPIHQAIIKLHSIANAENARQLLDALVNERVLLLLAEAEKMETCASLPFKGKPHLVVFTQNDLIPPKQLREYPHTLQVVLSRLGSSAAGVGPKVFMDLGLLINPGHPKVGWPIPPGVFKVLPEVVNAQVSALKEGGLYHVRGDNGKFSVLKILKIDEKGVHIRHYSNQFYPPPCTLDEASLYLAGKTLGSNETIGIGHAPVNRISFLAWNPRFFQLSRVTEAELEGYKIWLEAKGGYF